MDKKENLQERLQEIISMRIEKPQEANRSLQKLLPEIEKDGRSEILAEAYCYLADTYFRLRVVHKGIPTALKSLMYTRKNSESSALLPLIYNLIGVGYSSIGECAVAQEYYIKGLKYAKRYNDIDMEILLKINIGSLFLQLGDHKEGMSYIGSAYKGSNKILASKSFLKRGETEKLHAEELLNISLLNMADVSYHRGEYEAALKYLKSLTERKRARQSDFYDPNITTLCIKSHFKLNQRKEAESYLTELLEAVPSAENIELFSDYIEIVHILIDFTDFAQAEKVIGLIREVCRALCSITRWTQFYGVLVEYYKALGDRENYLESCVKYYESSSNNAEYFSKSVLSAIKNQIEIDISIERQKRKAARNEELKLLSETDELTGLLNRRSFNNLSQRYYQNAYYKQQMFALIILDIDCFKQYNDAYGHIAGDECLKTVSGILKDHNGEGFRAARYGGDEFVIMAQDQNEEKLKKYIKSVIEAIAIRDIPHEYSFVIPRITVSIGVAGIVPAEGSTVMDLLQQADDALYKAKQQGKNQYVITLE